MAKKDCSLFVGNSFEALSDNIIFIQQNISVIKHAMLFHKQYKYNLYTVQHTETISIRAKMEQCSC